MRVIVLSVAVFVCGLGLAVAKDKPKMPTIEEGAVRGAIQDIVGNICPGVQPDYTMRLVLIMNFRDKDAKKWADAYERGARELLGMIASREARRTVCENALSMYGPEGGEVPRLLQTE